MSVTTNLSDGNYALTFSAGVKVTDTAKPNKVQDLVSVGLGTFPAIGFNLTDGTGALKANKVWAGVLSIAASGSQTLVLSDGSLLGGAGQAVVFAKVRRMLIRFRTPVAGQKVTIGNAASHPWLWARDLSPATATKSVGDVGLEVEDTDGLAVSSGTADQLKFANPGGSTIAVDVVLIGE